jgi:serine/threonine-protein kinase RsbW
MNRKREIKIESSLEEMYRVEQFVEEISDEHMLYGSYFGNILMAVTEAVENAIIHGNQNDKSKRVIIKEELTRKGLWVTVSDEGNGFDYNEFLAREANPGSVLEKSGLLLIQKLCDELRFIHQGRTLEMLFRINGIDVKIFARREAFMQDFFKVYQKLSI